MTKRVNHRFCLFVLFTILLSQTTFAATYFWVGGTGDWADAANHWATTSGGSVFWNQVPSSADSVVFDDNSFVGVGDTVYVSGTTINCKDMDWRGLTNAALMPRFHSNGGALSLRIYGSLWLSNTMTFGSLQDLEFLALGAAELETGGNSIRGNLLFNSPTGIWILQDNLTNIINSELELRRGSLHTNGNTMTLVYLVASNTNPRSLDISNSVVNITGRSYGARRNTWNTTTSTNLTFNASNSTINFTQTIANSSGLLGSNGLVFNNVVFDRSGIIGGQSTFNDVTFLGNGRLEDDNIFDRILLSPNKTLTLNANTHQIINNDLVALGTCAGRITILASGHANFATLAFPNGPVVVDFINLQNVNITQGSITATNSIDFNGLSTGWTLTPSGSTTYFWIGGITGGSNWGDVANWSTTSGTVTGNTCLPSALDDVVFDASSFTAAGQQVLMNISGARFRNMTWLGVTNNPAFLSVNGVNSGFFCYGNLSYDANMTTDLRGAVHMVGIGNHTLQMNGQKFSHNLIFNSPTGEWTFQDDVYIEGPGGTRNLNQPGILYLICGRLNTNGANVRANAIHSSFDTPRELHLGSSYITLDGRDIGNSFEVWIFSNYTNLIFDAGSSTIEITDDLRTPSLGLYTASGQTFHNVLFSHPNTTGTVHGNNRFNKLTFLGSGNLGRYLSPSNNIIDSLLLTAGKTYTCRGGSNTTVGYLDANGTCNDWIFIKTFTPGSQANWQTIGGLGTINGSGMILQDNNAQNGTFTATNSVEIPLVSGWSLAGGASLDYYWIGGTGLWGNPVNWSLVSGNPAFTNGCIPGPDDDVFFDVNSFASVNDVVTIDVNTAYCRDMTWTGATGVPNFTYNGANQLLRVFGNLTMIANMTVNLTALDIYFNGALGNFTIESAGQALPDVFFIGAGSTWSQLDAMRSRNFFLTSGNFRTDGFPLSVNVYSSRSNFARTMDLGGSVMTVRGGATSNNSSTSWRSNGANYNFEEGTSTVRFTSGTLPSLIVTPDTFFNVEFTSPISTARLYANNYYNRVTFSGNAQLFSSATFDTLEFSPGKSYRLNSGATQTITNPGEFLSTGTSVSPINIFASVVGTQARIRKDSGVICLDYVDLRDNAAIGNADFYAGNHSSNTANNTGWVFDSCGLRDTLYVCEGDSILFDEDDFSIGTWFWDFDDPLSAPNHTSTLPAPLHLYSGPGVYAPTVDVFSLGSTDRRYKYVVVNPAPTGTLGQTYGTNPITFMDSASLTAGGGVSYVWSTGDTTATMTTTTGGNFTVTITDANGCSVVEQFTLGNPLAASGLRFGGEVEGQRSILHWRTESELNTSHFTLERSLDQIEYEWLTEVPAAFNSETTTTYSFIDEYGVIGNSHYRLKLYDQDGTLTETHDLTLFREEGLAQLSLLELYPQPNQGELNLGIFSPQGGAYQCHLIDLTGRDVFYSEGVFEPGRQNLQLNLGGISKGAYILEMVNGGTSIQARIVKQ